MFQKIFSPMIALMIVSAAQLCAAALTQVPVQPLLIGDGAAAPVALAAEALKKMDHALKESFSASFNRERRVEKTIFSELAQNLIDDVQLPACSGPLTLRSHGGFYELLGPACTDVLMTLRWESPRMQIQIPLASWAHRTTISAKARQTTTQCEVVTQKNSVLSVECKQVHQMEARGGSEVVFEQLSYDQGNTDVVRGQGVLVLADGKTEELTVRAPTQSEALYVQRVVKIEKTPEVEKEKKVAFKDVNPSEAKSEDIILQEMEGLAAEYEAEHGVLATPAEPAMQDTPEEALQEPETMVSPDGQPLVTESEDQEFYEEEESYGYEQDFEPRLHDEEVMVDGAAPVDYAMPSNTMSFDHTR